MNQQSVFIAPSKPSSGTTTTIPQSSGPPPKEVKETKRNIRRRSHENEYSRGEEFGRKRENRATTGRQSQRSKLFRGTKKMK